MPRPGMFPPTLNGRSVLAHVAPRSDERRIAPLFGSQLLVYVPTAANTLLGLTGSVASDRTPLWPQSSQPTWSSSGIQRFVRWSRRYAPPMSVRA